MHETELALHFELPPPLIPKPFLKAIKKLLSQFPFIFEHDYFRSLVFCPGRYSKNL